MKEKERIPEYYLKSSFYSRSVNIFENMFENLPPEYIMLQYKMEVKRYLARVTYT